MRHLGQTGIYAAPLKPNCRRQGFLYTHPAALKRLRTIICRAVRHLHFSKGATSLWRHNGKDQQVEYPTLGYSPVWRVLERRGEPCLEPTCGGRMEGICRLGGATCTGAAAGCPPIAPGTTGSKRDPAGTTADHSVLSGSESDRHGVHRLYAGGCRHSKPVSPCSALGGAVALGVTSSMPDLQAG